jgi:phenylacetate-coenzyme A ligase PaaK-like adenylate-forming protein
MRNDYQRDVNKKINSLLRNYILPDSTPVGKALYEPKNLFSVSKNKADEYRFKAIKYAFKHHYEKNFFYHKICKERRVKPDDIKNIKDFGKIPLLPHKFYKEYPQGRDFAVWLANIMSIEIPKIVIKGKNPSYDDVIEAFQNAGITVCYSSGTTGKFTFIPRDERTYKMGQYAIAKTAIEMFYDWYNPETYAYLLFPNPRKTNIYVGKVTNVLFDLTQDVRVAIDRKITTDLLRISMGVTFNFRERMMSRFIAKANKKINRDMVDGITKWIDKMAKKSKRILFAGAPFILDMVIKRLNEEGKTYNFGDKGAVLTGGGWKIYEDKRLSVSEFRKRVEETLGIPSENCLDLYAMVESNGFMVHCPEGHYLHVPTTYFHPMIFDKNNEPVGHSEEGRFAFLDSLAMSYPGFIITGDKVKLLESCPACGRPTPVLEPEIHRIKGEEIRGCAEEMRRMLLEG